MNKSLDSKLPDLLPAVGKKISYEQQQTATIFRRFSPIRTSLLIPNSNSNNHKLIINGTSSSSASSNHENILSKSADLSSEILKAQAIANERVSKAIEKQRYYMLQSEEHLTRKLRSEKLQNKQLQKNRYRSEVYAINALLKRLEVERFENMLKNKIGKVLSDSDSEDDSCGSLGSNDSPTKRNYSSTGSSRDRSISPRRCQTTSNTAGRTSYGV